MNETARSDAARVLVVDDEEAVCTALAEALVSPEVLVDSAASRAAAVAAARRRRPDLLVVDLRLPDGSGLDVIDDLREDRADLPAVIITGRPDPAALSEASRRRPVELLTKPLDLQRLNKTVRDELDRRGADRRARRRRRRLRQRTRRARRARRDAYRALCDTCTDLTGEYRGLQCQMERRDAVIGYQTRLLGCADVDDVFGRLFGLFVERSGVVFGVAMLCDAEAQLQMVGRFGVPFPDEPDFCRSLAGAVASEVVERPEVKVLDAVQHIEIFGPELHRRLVGVTLLAVPLMTDESSLIGLVVLYRKGEQPFTDDDVALAGLIAPPTAVAATRM